MNLWSSSNILMWINIGRELGFETISLVVTAVIALYLYL